VISVSVGEEDAVKASMDTSSEPKDHDADCGKVVNDATGISGSASSSSSNA
jgi:hypothetical protein